MKRMKNTDIEPTSPAKTGRGYVVLTPVNGGGYSGHPHSRLVSRFHCCDTLLYNKAGLKSVLRCRERNVYVPNVGYRHFLCACTDRFIHISSSPKLNAT